MNTLEKVAEGGQSQLQPQQRKVAQGVSQHRPTLDEADWTDWFA